MANNIEGLVERYTTDVQHKNKSLGSTIHPIKHIYGYLSSEELRYGIMTTYDRTWFFNALEISQAVHCDSQIPTLLQCYWYMVTLSSEDPSGGSAGTIFTSEDDNDDEYDHDGGGEGSNHSGRKRPGRKDHNGPV